MRRARVEAEYKVPKEKCRVRIIELVTPAIHYLKAQQPITMMLPQKKIKIKQRDNMTVKEEQVRLVFLNEQMTGQHSWTPASALRRFGSILKKAGIRHRGPNQCRHTFASQCLTHYVSKEWLAKQLGHSDITMINKHYGRWIPEDSPSIAKMVSKQLGFEAESGKKEDESVPI